MERGLYIAASGMLTEMVRQDQIANDLANASTPGYKSDRATQRSFGDILLANSVTGQTVGPLGLGSQIDRIVTDTTPAPARETGEPLDFAVVGEGWFGVQTAQGTRYTRNGQFALSPQGTLIDGMGNPVMGTGGGPVSVGPNGRVDPRQVGIFNVTGARKVGDNYVTGAAGGAATGTVRQGALEGSNADPARSMVDMIASFRAFESGQRVIRTIDETLAKASNVVGGMP
ncbi:MAG: flagellar basal-body rod protein FlgF [Thermoleophilaceae bacterium]|nr:flagellar basal-body rod protein FlgF [Thermoleophilaceae bacterium]